MRIVPKQSGWFQATAALPVLVLALLVPSIASAQGAGAGWLADRSRTEGPGFRLGDFELHPGVGVEIGYDSNLFYSDNPVGAAILRVTPHINISTLGAERRGEDENADSAGTPPVVNFRGGLSASYIAIFNDDTRDNFSLDADLRLTINPERPFSFTIYERLGRSIRPFTESARRPDGEPVNFARIRNEAGATFNFGTDGGIFGGQLGYAFLIDLFEGETFDYANNLTHRVSAGAQWKFLPNTALVYDFQMNIGQFINTGEVSAVARPDSYRLRSRVGINGAISETWSASAFIGYAAGFYDAPVPVDEYETFVAAAEARWKVSPTASLALGYDRDFFQSFAGVFGRRDRGYINGRVLIAGALFLGLEAGVGNIDFGPQVDETGAPIGVGGTSERSDILVNASIFGEYRFTDWLALSANVGYTGNFTDFQYSRDIDGAIVPDPADFQKFEAWLGVRAFY